MLSIFHMSARNETARVRCERTRTIEGRKISCFDESLNRSNRIADNYSDDDNNKSNNNFISSQSRIKSLLNGDGGEPEKKPAVHARARQGRV